MPIYLFINKKSLLSLSFIIIHYSLFIIHCSAQDSTKTKTWSLNGYIKDMEILLFNNVNEKFIASNLIHNRLNFKWFISPEIKFVAEDRNQLMYGELLKNIPGYGNTFKEDKGIVKLSHNFYNQKSTVLNSSIDRLYMDFTKDKFQITLGRQRINWGQTFVWNPNDIFNAYSYFDFDYEEKPGSDALRAQYYINSTDKTEIAFKENSDRQLTAAALYKFNKYSYDFQLLGGIMNGNDYVIGAGWAGEILKGGFRGEFSYFHRKNNFRDTTGILVGSIGYDYTFKNSLALQAEILYNGSKNSINSIGLTIGQNNNNSLSAKNPFLSGYSYFLSASYPITPLLSASLASIYNPDDKLIFIIPTLTYSINNNLDLTLLSQTFFSQSSSAKENKFYSIFMRLKWSF
jgi:hypothetical protein